jgi:hypothetical protein
MPDRNVKDPAVGKKVEALLPVTCGPQRNEHLMTALLQATAEIDQMSFGPREVLGR